MKLPIRVYVGAVHSHRLMVDVLRWSIQRHASRAVEVLSIGDLVGTGLPVPRKPENRPVTPFSFQRFAVPMLAGWQGRALYLDADQLVLRDIAELNDLPMPFGLRLRCRNGKGPDGRTGVHVSSVMLLACERLRDWEPQRIADAMDAGRLSYPGMMKLKPVWWKGGFSRHWNSLDHLEPGHTGLLHYTRRSTQPWIAAGHPNEDLWFGALYEGLDRGAIPRDSLDFAIEHRYVRPSFAWQVGRRALRAEGRPAELQAADEAFLAHCARHQYNNLDGDYRPT